MTFDKLFGKVISGVTISPDKYRLSITFTDGCTAILETEAECCSGTWIEHLTVPDAVIGQPIVSVEDFGQVDSESFGTYEEPTNYYELIRYYETRFVTPAGVIVCEYRNGSNGYYGGSLYLSNIECPA